MICPKCNSESITNFCYFCEKESKLSWGYRRVQRESWYKYTNNKDLKFEVKSKIVNVYNKSLSIKINNIYVYDDKIYYKIVKLMNSFICLLYNYETKKINLAKGFSVCYDKLNDYEMYITNNFYLGDEKYFIFAKQNIDNFIDDLFELDIHDIYLPMINSLSTSYSGEFSNYRDIDNPIEKRRELKYEDTYEKFNNC